MNRGGGTMFDLGTIDTRRTPRRLESWGLGFLALPTLVFLMFTVAEALGGETGWWSHLIQLAGVVVLGVVAWARPRIGGPLLALTGLALAGALVSSDLDVVGQLASAAIVWVPLVLAGVLVTIAGHRRPAHRSPALRQRKAAIGDASRTVTRS